MRSGPFLRGVVLLGLLSVALPQCARGGPILDRIKERREQRQAEQGGSSPTAREATPSAGGGEDRDEILTVDGRDRAYYLHLPPKTGASSYPLVFNFHGGRGNAHQQAELTGFNAYADRYGFFVVYPEGIEKNWADGRGTTEPDKQGIDDVKFVRALHQKLKSAYPVDPKRVFSTGISNGGMLSYRLACDMADVFAAIGPVVGSLASKYRGNCKPADAVSVVSIMGTDDEIVSPRGGEMTKGEGGALESETAVREFWAQRDGCTEGPSVTDLPVKVDDGTRVRKTVHTGCKKGADVVFYTVSGGGHTWPPHEYKSFILNRMAGKTSKNIDATQVIWDFFSKHPKP